MLNIDQKTLTAFQERYGKDLQSQAVAGAIAKVGLYEASVNQNAIRRHNFVFSEEPKIGKITNQKASGRCWMFSALNVARLSIMEHFNMETFEFSQAYTFFYDKLEKANYFLESILETLDEKKDSRLINHLLQAPVQDGGQWDMFKGILAKYGCVPKELMPETFHSSNSGGMDTYLTSLLRSYAHELRTAHQKEGKTATELRERKTDMLYAVYNLLVKCLGQPPVKFSYSYRNKDKKFVRLPETTPQEFFEKYVGWNLKDMVSLINAPTEDKPYGHTYTVKFLGTVKEAAPICYLNVPIEVLKQAAVASIKDGHPVWFGCDVGKCLLSKNGIMDLDIYNYDLTVGNGSKLNKAERLDYCDSLLTHAMVLAGVDLAEDGKSLNWKVENSWGKDAGKDGIYSMTDAWFDEYTYQIMVDKKYVPAEYQAALTEQPKALEPWDPFGALALVM
ncbi:C1 family peptidase [Amygdalobacter nucleatus]|uniref:aminopeptidase C n=1 Tax=Amygdalobacter nucleatus TaxID=3029274 RepID=UPI00279CB232|nr:C1 family peptidase [Amygdalobacter nucleatus]WEG37044.1 C1 family peptidase [Amygdalobacter nucleatus]